MKKADMENHFREYCSLMSKAREEEKAGLYSAALKSAVSAWDHIDGMMLYQDRELGQKEFTSVEAVDLVLTYAPLLLDFALLDHLGLLLKEYGRIEKRTSADMGEKLVKATKRMWAAHRLWDYFEMHPDAREDELAGVLGGDLRQWESIITGWQEMGLLQRTQDQGSYRVAFHTRMGQVVSAKCSSCGSITEGPKAMFLEALLCQECHVSGLFVFLAPRRSADAKE